jgi:hypothetical protein
MAQSKALRDALQGFKNQVNLLCLCQFVFSKEYYLNSVADKVYINPVGVKWILKACHQKSCITKTYKKSQV